MIAHSQVLLFLTPAHPLQSPPFRIWPTLPEYFDRTYGTACGRGPSDHRSCAISYSLHCILRVRVFSSKKKPADMTHIPNHVRILDQGGLILPTKTAFAFFHKFGKQLFDSHLNEVPIAFCQPPKSTYIIIYLYPDKLTYSIFHTHGRVSHVYMVTDATAKTPRCCPLACLGKCIASCQRGKHPV